MYHFVNSSTTFAMACVQNVQAVPGVQFLALLSGWALLNVQLEVQLEAQSCTYCFEGEFTMTTIDQQRYVSIATKKHDGSWVWTPVWFAQCSGKGVFYAFSAGAAGKVKRLRNYPEIQVAPCTASGKILGQSIAGSAWLECDAEQCAAAYVALGQKYGWQMALLDLFSQLSGNFNKRRMLGFSLGAQ